MDTSQRSPATSPAPTAGPLIADTRGLLQSRMLYTSARASFHVSTRFSNDCMFRSMRSKSPPAENALPAPVRITQSMSGSASIFGHR